MHPWNSKMFCEKCCPLEKYAQFEHILYLIRCCLHIDLFFTHRTNNNRNNKNNKTYIKWHKLSVSQSDKFLFFVFYLIRSLSIDFLDNNFENKKKYIFYLELDFSFKFALSSFTTVFLAFVAYGGGKESKDADKRCRREKAKIDDTCAFDQTWISKYTHRGTERVLNSMTFSYQIHGQYSFWMIIILIDNTDSVY